jgi:hypothetical protein
LLGNGGADRPLIVVVVEIFNGSTVCAGAESYISRACCAKSAVEGSVEVRRVLCTGQAGQAGNNKKRKKLYIWEKVYIGTAQRGYEKKKILEIKDLAIDFLTSFAR